MIVDKMFANAGGARRPGVRPPDRAERAAVPERALPQARPTPRPVPGRRRLFNLSGLAALAMPLLALPLPASMAMVAAGPASAFAQTLAATEERGAGSSADPETRSIADRSQLAPGDRLTISVFDQPDLSGPFFVDADGSINFPLLGQLPVAGMTTQAVQATLAERLSGGFLQDPTVIVRLTELRAVTVVGAVRTPGRYAFLEGMTVSAAIALAGGPSLLNLEETQARADFLTAKERLKLLEVGYIGQLARRARLEASLGGGAIEPPQVSEADRALLASFLAVEEKVLASSIEARGRQRAVLDEQVKQVEADIGVFSQQIALETEQIELLDRQLADANRLLANGLTRKANVIEFERERSRSRANLAQLSGSLGRARSLQIEAQFRLEQLETTARNEDLTAFQAVNQQIAEAEATLSIAGEISEVRALRAAQLPPDVKGPPSVRLTRFRDGSFEVETAGLSDPVWPGDIIQVGSDASAMTARPLPAAGAPDEGAPTSADLANNAPDRP
ncbi:polysaccharide biosynthesis/export family protein [Fulvimarina sp. 2208YS6-2-32]|uniref:Polysaccharide biosynthesis/export family protein n=1 Tax=Fulvimarina uroteuthidis TaxID=3098149 RepID=A0ABU5I1U2_9HYPH|nr:polysaccharide biosynthesis/export family protein [Fulvimarina sp. 2208YS6-2-32]MDY8108789.1 polysaccharide biosynthesis/export family protein [Fulvimarina sp. 2208YS6-2-32]